LVLVLAAGAAGCRPRHQQLCQGYLEGEFVAVAAPVGGTLERLDIRRGDPVQPGQSLYQLDLEPEATALREARHRLDQARARQTNLTKGRRPSELASLEAQLDRARATLRLSELDLERRVRLSSDAVIAPAELDLAQARCDADRAAVTALTADLETARLAAREDELAAAAAEVKALTAAVARAQWALAQKTQDAPTNAWVHEVLFRPGEWVAPGAPVVLLLPPENIRARFYVPEADLARCRLGGAVQVHLDGIPNPLRATIDHVSAQAEFTPPVLYNRENRAKLVFRVEARFEPAEARTLRIGQPADVVLPSGDS